jgi:hypothetical protein
MEFKNVPARHIQTRIFIIVRLELLGKVKTSASNKKSKQAGSPRLAASADCFISKTDVAMRLGKTARTVEQWMLRGVIPYIKIGKGRRATVLFKWADIETHLKSNFGVGFNFDQ